jgi:hypothetical protein
LLVVPRIALEHHDAEVVLRSLNVLLTLLATGNSYHDVAVQSDVIESILTLMTEAQAKSKVSTTDV